MTELSSTADVFDIMHTCRAMRRLKPDPVPEDVLVKLVDAAIQAFTVVGRELGVTR